MGISIFQEHELIRPGDLVFDVGCKVGKFTDTFLELGARVICVEPFPANVAFMRTKYGDSITIIEAAISDAPGWGALHYNSNNKINPSLAPTIYVKQYSKNTTIYNQSVDVALTTIDELVKYHGMPAFVKLDIEGSEYQALCGMAVPVPALSFEFALGYIKEAHKCIQRLGEMDYEFNYSLGHHGFVNDEWLPRGEFDIECETYNVDGKFRWGNVYARMKGGE